MQVTSPVVDHTAIERLRGFGGPKLVRGMIELFLSNAPAKAADAREALECGDSAALRAALHGLKSSAGQLGAQSLYQSCIAGEELASRGELTPCAPVVERIEADLPRVSRELQAIQLQQ